MRRDAVLVVLVFAGAGLCWWPAIIEPSLDFPGWLMLVPVALCTGLASMLSGRRWRLVGAGAAGSLAGLWSGIAIWPASDPIAGSYSLFVIAAGAGSALVVAVAAMLLGACLGEWGQGRARIVWISLVGSAALGPALLAATGPVVAYRLARNDRLARERFLQLKEAVEMARADSGSASFCDGQVLRKHYAGPVFNDDAWLYIAGNFVKQDGYEFGINCNRWQAAYTIDVMPARGTGDGTLRFCTDESGVVGCGSEYAERRNRCVPCRR